MLKFFWKIVPNNYKWSVAIKKVSYTAAKLLVGAVAGWSAGKAIGPDKLKVLEETVAVIVAGGLTFVHDWAQLKWPQNKWL